MIKTSREEENKSFHAAQARLQQMKRVGGDTRTVGQYYSALKAEGFEDAAATRAVFGLNPGSVFKPKKED